MNKHTPQEWADFTGCLVEVRSNESAYLRLPDGSCHEIPDDLIEIDDEDIDNMVFAGKPNLWNQMKTMKHWKEKA